MFIYQNKLISQKEFDDKVHSETNILKQSKQIQYILHCEDLFVFAIKFFALIQAQKTIILPPNNQKKTLDQLEFKLKDLPNSQIVFFTSGSTGEPKFIIKNFSNLQIEINELKKLWGNNLKNSVFLSTVSHQHIYGLLFHLLLPLSLNTKINCSIINTQEELIAKIQTFELCTLITSPAFIKRLDEKEKIISKKIQYSFSSGGILKKEIANKIQMISTNLIEVLGSTETGGIAHRQTQKTNTWEVFPLIQIKKQEKLLVKSPYILEGNYIETGDTIEFIDEKHFLLKERLDNIVKIEEKRVSLLEIENRLSEHEFIKDCHACVLESNRQIIAILAILSEKGLEYLTCNKKISLNTLLRKYLLDYFEPVLLPRKWLYVDELPINLQGKLCKKEIQNLFNQK